MQSPPTIDFKRVCESLRLMESALEDVRITSVDIEFRLDKIGEADEEQLRRVRVNLAGGARK